MFNLQLFSQAARAKGTPTASNIAHTHTTTTHTCNTQLLHYTLHYTPHALLHTNHSTQTTATNLEAPVASGW